MHVIIHAIQNKAATRHVQDEAGHDEKTRQAAQLWYACPACVPCHAARRATRPVVPGVMGGLCSLHVCHICAGATGARHVSERVAPRPSVDEPRRVRRGALVLRGGRGGCRAAAGRRRSGLMSTKQPARLRGEQLAQRMAREGVAWQLLWALREDAVHLRGKEQPRAVRRDARGEQNACKRSCALSYFSSSIR